MSFRRRFLSESGCKSSGFIDNSQIYTQLFSYFFEVFFLNDWLSDMFYNIFSLQVAATKIPIYHIIYMRAREVRTFSFVLKQKKKVPKRKIQGSRLRRYSDIA